MLAVKTAFASRLQYLIQKHWVERANTMGMEVGSIGEKITNMGHLITELGSNPKMESFQNWYGLCYKDTEMKGPGKHDAETSIMKEMNIQYFDMSKANGCLGKLLSYVASKEQETIQRKSKANQCLHLVKSQPKGKNLLAQVDKSARNSTRRTGGDYYIVRSDSKGKAISHCKYNVSEVLENISAKVYARTNTPLVFQM